MTQAPARLAGRSWRFWWRFWRWLLALALSGSGAVATAGMALATADGQFSLKADHQALVVTDGAGLSLKTWPLRDRDGQPVQVVALAHHAARQSFVVALAGAPELWLISHDPAAPPLFNGWVHDWRMGEGIAEPGYLGSQRVRLAQPFKALWVDARVPWVLGEVVLGGARQAAVLNLDIRREITWLPLNGPLAMARLFAHHAGAWQLALPDQVGWRVFETHRWQWRWLDRLPGP